MTNTALSSTWPSTGAAVAAAADGVDASKADGVLTEVVVAV